MSTPQQLLPGKRVIPCFHSALPSTWTVVGDGAGLYAAAGGETIEIHSTDNTKDLLAGTGARVVKVLVLLDDGTTKVLSGNLNGTGAVALVPDTNVIAVLDAWVSSYGSDETNAGTITIRKETAGGDRLKIPVGRKRAAPGQFKVPPGFRFMLQGAHLGFTNNAASGPLTAEAEIEAQVNPEDGSFMPAFTRVGPPAAATFNRPLRFEWPLEEAIPAGAWIRMRAQMVAANIAAGAFWGRLERIATPEEGGN